MTPGRFAHLELAAQGFVSQPNVRAAPRPLTLKKIGYDPTPENLAIFEKVVLSKSTCKLSANFGNLLIRELRLEKAGDYHQGHRHQFDHVTMLFRGKVICEVDGSPPQTYEAPSAIEIRADKWHKFTALEDDTLYFCVFANRNDPSDPFANAQMSGAELPIEDDELKIFMEKAGAKSCSASCSASCSSAKI